VSLQNRLVQVIDTAGMHATTDPIESEGIRRGEAALQRCDLALFIVDSTQQFHEEDQRLWEKIPCKKKVMVLNKSDLPIGIDIEAMRAQYPKNPVVYCSAKTGKQFSELSNVLFESLFPDKEEEASPLIALLRQKNAMERASHALKRALQSAKEAASVEFISSDLREALDGFGEILGETTTDEILNQIFSRFCIGK
jgi:tRNA modification GTPase